MSLVPEKRGQISGVPSATASEVSSSRAALGFEYMFRSFVCEFLSRISASTINESMVSLDSLTKLSCGIPYPPNVTGSLIFCTSSVVTVWITLGLSLLVCEGGGGGRSRQEGRFASATPGREVELEVPKRRDRWIQHDHTVSRLWRANITILRCPAHSRLCCLFCNISNALDITENISQNFPAGARSSGPRSFNVKRQTPRT